MLRWWLSRLLWSLPTLVGVTFVTFFVLDRAPVDRAALEIARRAEESGTAAAGEREVALARLRIRYGLVDPMTLEPVPVHVRYGRWLADAARLRLSGPGEDPVEFRARLARAAPVTLGLGALSLLVAFGLGVPFGARLGLRAGSRGERAASAATFALLGLPDALVATLLLLCFAGPVFAWFPAGGLGGPGFFDHAHHLVLPVLAMSLGPFLLVVRFLRESVARAKDAPFAQNLDAWGFEPRERDRRVVRAALAPLATLVGGLLPMLVTGSVVVESTFAIDGMGRLLWNAVQTNDHAMVMAITLISAVVTLAALVLSDLAHRALDPRVRLAS